METTSSRSPGRCWAARAGGARAAFPLEGKHPGTAGNPVRAACPGRASEAACGNQPGRPAARPWEVVMSVIKAVDLAYGRLRSPDLDKQEEFLTAFGMVRADRTAKALYMRGTDSPHHIHVTELGAPKYVGIALHAGSPDDLEKLARTPGASPIESIDEQGGGKRVRLTDPDGFQVEIVHGMAQVPKIP